MVGGGDVVQYAQPETLARLEQPVQPTPAIPGEFKQKLFSVTAMRDVPDVSLQIAPISPRRNVLP